MGDPQPLGELRERHPTLGTIVAEAAGSGQIGDSPRAGHVAARVGSGCRDLLGQLPIKKPQGGELLIDRYSVLLDKVLRMSC